MGNVDPNVNLNHQINTAAAILMLVEAYPDGFSAEAFREVHELSRDLAEHVVALHKWISGGGELPYPWAQAQLTNQVVDPVMTSFEEDEFAVEHPRGCKCNGCAVCETCNARRKIWNTSCTRTDSGGCITEVEGAECRVCAKTRGVKR